MTFLEQSYNPNKGDKIARRLKSVGRLIEVKLLFRNKKKRRYKSNY